MKCRIALLAESQCWQNGRFLSIARLVSGVFCVFCAFCVVANPVFGQYYYEKNKVETQNYNYRTIQTAHFRIYFYQGGEELASYTAKIAEEYYKSISTDLDVQQEALVPIILYNSPNAFTETNVEQDIIDEATGGFSEQFKNRVVVPFDGSYARFKKVLWHEITHIFQFELFNSRMASILGSEFQMPQWVAEGMAEYASGGVELGNEIFMRDLVINNRLMTIDRLTEVEGYISYREGEAIFRYIEDHYGRKKVFEFVHALKNRHDVNEAFSATFGESTAKFSAEFEAYLRDKYWPQITRQGSFKQVGKLLTDHVADGSVYNTSPAISPSGTKIAFISDRNEYDDVYVISAVDGKVLKHLISGERSGGFESVHPYRAGISWSPDESSIVLASKANGRDCLTIVAYPSGKVRKRIFPNVDAVYSPVFSPDGTRILFTGLKDCYSDLFVYDLKSGQLSRKTADIYEDRDPSFSASGDSILFVSDRPDGDTWQPGNYAVFIATDSAAPVRLTPRTDYVAYPAFMPGDTEIAFVTSDSSYDMYVYSLAAKRVVRRTDFLGGVYYPTFSRDGRRLVLAYYDNYGWDIACIKDPLTSLPLRTETLLTAERDTETYRETGLDESRVKPYSPKLSADYAIGGASYTVGEGLASAEGSIDVSFSDELGNNNLYLTTDVVGDVLNSDFSLYWLDLRHRLQDGVGISQQFDYGYYDTLGSIYRQRDLGISGLFSYPFDKFTRLEFDPSIFARQFQLFPVNVPGDSYDTGPYAWYRILQPDVAFVFDNSYWGTMTAPERGTRFRAEAYGSVLSGLEDASAPGLFPARQDYASVLVDYRNYIKLGRRYVWANRLLGIASFGPEHEHFTLGGEWVRGYEYYEFADNPASRMAVFSSELRFPFVDRLKLAFPLPIDLTDLRGVAFFDAGMAKDGQPVIYDHGQLRDLKAGIGAGFRFQISYFEIKLDWGWPLSSLSVDTTGNERQRAGTWYFSLGYDF